MKKKTFKSPVCRGEEKRNLKVERKRRDLKSHINGEEEDYEETDKTLTEHS